jgi:aminomethyltransferase
VTDTLDPAIRRSPLHDVHEEAGASFTDFAGWYMPVRYGSELAEHHAVRTAAGLFDISHMAELRITGPDAAAFLDASLASDIAPLAVGRAKYTLLLDAGGGILDDLIVYHDEPGRYLVVANAGNHGVVVDAFASRSAGFDVTVADRTDELALLAVQGPRSRKILEATAGLDIPTLADLRYYACAPGTFEGTPILVARTGYTGEDGYELYVEVADAACAWRALAAAGESLGLIPAGLASRDTLRLEAGMPLYGHELGLDTLPAQAGLGRVVSTRKEFVGKHALDAGSPDPGRVLVGLVSEGRRAGRAGYPVLDPTGAEVGIVTSGALSPTLGHPIAMAYLDRSLADPGTDVLIDVRGSRIAATVVPLPFYSREKL